MNRMAHGFLSRARETLASPEVADAAYVPSVPQRPRILSDTSSEDEAAEETFVPFLEFPPELRPADLHWSTDSETD